MSASGPRLGWGMHGVHGVGTRQGNKLHKKRRLGHTRAAQVVPEPLACNGGDETDARTMGGWMVGRQEGGRGRNHQIKKKRGGTPHSTSNI